MSRVRRLRQGQDGFTLIELMVAVLIVGVLLAIAVPTLLSAQESSKTKAATSNLRSALSAGKTFYATDQTYVATAVDWEATEPSLTWRTQPSTRPSVISFAGTDRTLGLAARSEADDCFYVYDDVKPASGGTKYGKIVKGAGSNCRGDLAATYATATSPEAAGW